MAEGQAIKTSDLFVQCLEAEGVEYVFGVPGEENLDLLDSLSRSDIRLVLTRHEQGAGFMAATYGRHTGKTGVCIATLGPGATNFVTAAAYAQLGGMPMMMITGQKPIKKSKQGQFQILDVVAMMEPITKYTRQLHAGDNIPSRVREAYRLAEEEKPGAVHLELPEDIAEEPTDAAPIPRSVARRPSAEPKAVDQAVAALEQEDQPMGATVRFPVVSVRHNDTGRSPCLTRGLVRHPARRVDLSAAQLLDFGCGFRRCPALCLRPSLPRIRARAAARPRQPSWARGSLRVPGLPCCRSRARPRA